MPIPNRPKPPAVRPKPASTTPVRAVLDGPVKAKLKAVHGKIDALLERRAAFSDALTEREWQSLADASDLLKEALGQNTSSATAVYRRRAFQAKLSNALRGGRA